MSFIVIKHYIGGIDSLYTDVNERKIRKLIKEMKAYASLHARKLIYVTLANPVEEGLPLESDTYAEVEYTEELTQSEKNEYINFLKKLSLSEGFEGRNPAPLHCTLEAVRFIKISEEISAIPSEVR